MPGRRGGRCCRSTRPAMRREIRRISSTARSPAARILISLDLLADEGLLDDADLAAARRPERRTPSRSFDARFAFRMRAGCARRSSDFDRDVASQRALSRHSARAQRSWLDDWSLYAALRECARRRSPGTNWPEPLRLREPQAMREVRRQARRTRFASSSSCSSSSTSSGRRCATTAMRRGVGLIGDIPIFVAHDSADVWAHRDLFLLDGDGHAARPSAGTRRTRSTSSAKAGATRSTTGRRTRKRSFAWWVRGSARRCGCSRRADRPLPRLPPHWHDPAPRCEDARATGKWVAVAGRGAVRRGARRMLGPSTIIAEDLGKLDAARRGAARPLRFSRHADHAVRLRRRRQDITCRTVSRALRRVHRHARQRHDRRLVRRAAHRSLQKASATAPELRKLLRYVTDNTGGEIHWGLIRSVMASVPIR